ncbi:hypothetical protein NYQ10_12770 [Flavobacterium johnsoniae]|uniref:hypothetical protein n=1 Tax=Flavobacterium johnsoniae TaxID=986 RepID=UPI0025AFDCD0|nr:hypothetical protein [Flavobacterium johnsoniae]WJS92960.1 hypothetical protein NYQ10_12770 [Flavobacterium johnsoniae]
MVTFETKVWEKDWEYILKGNYLNKIIFNCNFNFSKKHVIINNVKNRKLVEKYCKQKIKEGVIDNYFVVEDYESLVLDHFELSADSFDGGYYYSIAELVGIYKCETDYLMHFSGDSFPVNNNINWIKNAIEIMYRNPNIIVANPTWNYNFREAEKESFEQIEDFYSGYGFSDQAYLIRKQDFIEKIYKEKNKDSERYPKYGGELFEKKVDSFMRNHQKLRITNKYCTYISVNFPRNWFSRKILRNNITKKRINQMTEKH